MVTAMEKSDSYNNKIEQRDKHLTLAPGTRAPGRSVTGISEISDLRNSINDFTETRRSAMRGSSPRKQEKNKDLDIKKLESGEAEDLFAANLMRISELADSQVSEIKESKKDKAAEE